MIDSELASGKKRGYRFDVNIAEGMWSAIARPLEPGKTGTRSFFVDQTGIIRWQECISLTNPSANERSSVLE